MVDQINFPAPQAWSGGADFSPLANLGNVYRDAQSEAAKSRALSQLGADPNANMQTLLQSGVPSLATIGLNLQQKGIEQQREDQRNAIADYYRQQEEARRQGTYDEDSPEARTKKIVAAGLDPKTPEAMRYIAAGGALSAPPKPQFEIKTIKDPSTGTERVVRIPVEGPEGPIDIPPAKGSTGVDQSTLTGEDFIKTLPPQRAAMVKGITDFSIDPNKLSIVGGHREGLLADAKQYDPTYVAAYAPARAAAIKEFIAGGPNSPASTIVSGGTTIGHLLHASDTSQKLGGPAGFGPATSAINKARIQYLENQNDPDLKEYNTMLGRIAEEGTKFYRGVGGTESDIKRDIETMTPAQSQQSRDRGLATQAMAMYSKVQALQDRWKNAVGPKAWDRISKEQDFPVISRANIRGVNTILQRGGLPLIPVPEELKPPPSGLGAKADAILEDARLAIASKVPRAAVIDRLKQAGIDEKYLE
jgi:hypothetical protein